MKLSQVAGRQVQRPFEQAHQPPRQLQHRVGIGVAGRAEAGHQRLVGPLVGADGLDAEVEAFLQVGRLADVQRLPADGIEAALERPAVDMPALLRRPAAARRSGARRRRPAPRTAGVDTVADDAEEAGAAQRGVDRARLLAAVPADRSISGTGIVGGPQGRTFIAFTNSVV
jgi:hypothetical protein